MSAERDALKQRLLTLMQQPNFMPMRKRGLAKKLRVDDEDYAAFRRLVEDMADAGDIAEVKKGKYGMPRGDGESRRRGPDAGSAAVGGEVPKGARVGRIDIKRAGFGFLLSEPPGNDLYIGQDDLGGALSGDLVAVTTKHGKRGRRGGGYGRPSGRVVKVLERARAKLVGTFHARGKFAFVEPDARGLFGEIPVAFEDRGEAQEGDKVAIELIEPETSHRGGHLPSGRVVEVYGEAGEARAEILSIIENFSLRTKFPEDVLREAEAIPVTIPAPELAQRVDYTTPLTFTIDPDDAKDHDDAVALRTREDGLTELLVHIADVSYYVRDGAPIDKEARERGTSVYLPGQVLPMLPEKLSSNLCSLKEGELRPTKTVRIAFTQNLHPAEIHIERSFIRSAAFLTYGRVKKAVDAEDPSQVPSKEIYDALCAMKAFSQRIRAKRLDANAIDLDLPEVRLKLDEHGKVTGWEKEVHDWSHQLIEEFMLAANRAVATYLVDHEIDGLFRIHEDPDPDALDNFVKFVREFGISIRQPIDRTKIRMVLDKVRGKAYQHAVHLALLTSLKQARYNAECKPHFALNFSRYLHFTSPIRRYPDLVVHRALDERFQPGEKALPQRGKKRRGGEQGSQHFARLGKLYALAAHCSKRERDAAAAEEEVKKVRRIEYLRAHMRDAHPGVITGVREFGLFVEMQDCYVEGMVRMQDLDDDWYEYFEEQHLLQGQRRGRSFRLGDKVSVRVIHIDLGRRQVNLEIV